MAAQKTAKMSVMLDSRGRVTGASKPTEYQPARGGDEPVVTTGMAAGPGQSALEVDVSPELANLHGDELISRLAEHESVQSVMASLPTIGQGPTAGEGPAPGGPRGGSSQGLPVGAIAAGSL